MTRIGLTLALVAVLAATGAAAPATGGARILKTRGRVVDLAADGPRVAIGVEATAGACDRLVVWNPAARKTVAWDARTSCPPGDQTSAGEFLVEVGLAGTRAAWVEAYQGNLQDLLLWSKTLTGARRQVGFAENGSGAEGSPVGDYLGHLHGDGSLLVYDTWSVCVAYPAGFVVDPRPDPPCDAPVPGTEPVEVAYDEELFRLGPTATPLAAGPLALAAEAVDAGRIATLQRDRVTLLDAAGGTLATVAVAPGSVHGLALSGSQLALLRDNGKIEAYDAGTGAQVQTTSVALPLTARLTDLKDGVAVAVSGSRLWLVRLAEDEADVVTAPRAIVDAELEAAGLFYAWNMAGAPRGRVAFVPWSQLGSLPG